MWDILYCICPLISTIITFCKAQRMLWATPVSNNNLRHNFQRKLFSCVQWSPILVTRFRGKKWEDVPKKTFGSLSKSNDEKEQEKKKKGNCKPFCVTSWYLYVDAPVALFCPKPCCKLSFSGFSHSTVLCWNQCKSLIINHSVIIIRKHIMLLLVFFHAELSIIFIS